MIDTKMADDTVESVAAIAAYIGKTERQTFYLLEKQLIPGFKLGGKWHMRKSSYSAHIARLEAEAMTPPKVEAAA